jgi:hypothetical protein
VDPSRDSGSSYRYLLDWHRDCYVEDGPEKWKDRLCKGPGGQHHLTIDEKRRILHTKLATQAVTLLDTSSSGTS